MNYTSESEYGSGQKEIIENVINVDDLNILKQNHYFYLKNVLKITVYVCEIQFLWLQLIISCSLQGHDRCSACEANDVNLSKDL